MTDNERELLLAVARILRARLKKTFETTGDKTDLEDWNDIKYVLRPFDPLAAEPVNEAFNPAEYLK